jgi:DNA-binding CsgD family transcriptional regulator
VATLWGFAGNRPLRGRDEVLTLCTATWSRICEDGDLAVVLLEGPPGIGKTRLLDELADVIGVRPIRAAATMCVDGELPFGLAVSMVNDGLDLLATLDATAVTPEHSRLVLFDRFRRRLLSGDGPLLVLIDDLHWSDATSLDFLYYVLSRGSGSQALIVMTCRTLEPGGGGNASAIRELRRRDHVQAVEVGPLGLPDQLAVLDDLQSPDLSGSAIEIASHAAGNPYLLLETAREFLQTGRIRSPTLVDSIRGRATACDLHERRMLQFLAALGTPADESAFSMLLEVAVDVVRTSLRNLIRLDLLRIVGGRIEFAHPLVAEVIDETTLPSESRSLHQRIVDQYNTGSLPAVSIGALARHHELSGDSVGSALLWHKAAQEAHQRGMFADAVGLWRRSLADETDADARAEIVCRLADAIGWTGDPAEAVRMLRNEIDATRASVVSTATLLERVHDHATTLGDSATAVAVLGAAIEMPLADGNEALRSKLIGLAAFRAFLAGDHLAAWEHARIAMALAETADTAESRAQAQMVAGLCAHAAGNTSTGIAHLEAAHVLAVESGQLVLQVRVASNLVYVLIESARFPEALETAQRCRQVLVSQDLDASIGSILTYNMSGLLHLLGQWDEAVDLANRVIDADVSGSESGYMYLQLAEIDAQRGSTDAARHRLRSAEAAGVPAGPFHVESALTQATIAMIDGRWTETVTHAIAALAVPGITPVSQARSLAIASTGVKSLTHRQGDRRLAAQVTEALDRFSELCEPTRDGALCHAYLLQAHAELATTSADYNWTRALAAWEELKVPYAQAYCRLRLADHVAPDQRARHLQLAYGIAERLEARPLAKQIEATARTRRVPLGRASAAIDRAAALTRREHEVLALVADGCTNRQISANLFLGERTVHYYVSNILTKLQVSNRNAAAARFREMANS